MDEESFLIHEQHSKDHLERIRNRVERKEWAIFKTKLSRNPAKALTGFARWKYQRKLDWYKFKMSYQDFVKQAELWNSSFKAIEGYFGSGVLAYFRFLKWLLQMNVVIMLLWLFFVVIPEASLTPEGSEAFAQRDLADPKLIHLAEQCSQQYQPGNNATGFVEGLIAILEGTGWLAESLMFYGVYSDTYLVSERSQNQSAVTISTVAPPTTNHPFNIVNETTPNMSVGGVTTEVPSSNVSEGYNLALAYIAVTLTYLLVSLFMMCVHTGDTLKMQILTGWKMKTFRAYSNIVFGGWDFALTDPRAAELRHYNLGYEITSSLEEDRDSERRSNRTLIDKFFLLLVRLVINAFVIVVLILGGWLIFFTQNQMADRELDPDFPDMDPITQLLIKYIPPITITGLNAAVPVLFTAIVQFEDYKPDHQIQLTLVRTVFLRLASLAVLIATLYKQITCQPTDSCGIGIPPKCPQFKCWETYVGEQFYKLVIINFFVNIATAFFYELPRRLVVHHFPNKLTLLVGLPQFQIPKNVLDLVFLQCLAWIGSFFAPLLPVIVVLQLIFIFYIKRYTTMNNYVPSKRPYRASMANVFFMIVLMVSFLLCCIPIGYVAGVVTPSTGCGPFRAYEQQYSVVQRVIDQWPAFPKNTLLFFQSPPVIMITILLLCIVIYFYHATSGTKQELIDLLREQMSEESRDKQFLLMRLNEVTGESSHGTGLVKKGQKSKLATQEAQRKQSVTPTYDSMGDTKE